MNLFQSIQSRQAELARLEVAASDSSDPLGQHEAREDIARINREIHQLAGQLDIGAHVASLIILAMEQLPEVGASRHLALARTHLEDALLRVRLETGKIEL